MNKKEVNWLLETIKDPEAAKRFVLALYECGRISRQVLADVAQEHGWINRKANQFLSMMSHHSAEYAARALTAAA